MKNIIFGVPAFGMPTSEYKQTLEKTVMNDIRAEISSRERVKRLERKLKDAAQIISKNKHEIKTAYIECDDMRLYCEELEDTVRNLNIKNNDLDAKLYHANNRIDLLGKDLYRESGRNDALWQIINRAMPEK